LPAIGTENKLLTFKEETIEEGQTRLCLIPGCSYLIRDEVEKSYEVFLDLVNSGLKGLCITRKFPPRVRQQYKLKKMPILWLTEEKADDEMTVYSLLDISIMISQFLENTKNCAVLFDGFEFLVVNHGFESFIKFLQSIRCRFEQKRGILIAPILEEALSIKDAKLIEREMKPLRI